MCFFGSCICHPGYRGPNCLESFAPENPWYTEDCPNLRENITFNIDTTNLSRGRGCNPPGQQGSGKNYCAYLSYSHPDYGVPFIPKEIWHIAQNAEGSLWREYVVTVSTANDRSDKHFEGFHDYGAIPKDMSLGDVIEVGSGPWTQSRTMIFKRPDLKVKSFNILEPGAPFYQKEVKCCSYFYGEIA